jgi:hypothetical protein
MMKRRAFFLQDTAASETLIACVCERVGILESGRYFALKSA